MPPPLTVCVLHVIPEDGLGGVEIAARTAAARVGEALQVASLTDGPPGDLPANVHYLRGASASALARRLKADVAVFSLWKSIPALIMTRLTAPGIRTVLFLHSDRPVHLADRWLTALAARLVDQVWADSPESLKGRLGEAGLLKGRIISFVRHRPDPPVRAEPRPAFIYWGRLTPLKRIDRAIRLFARIAANRTDARLTLIGPDAGSQGELEALARTLGMADRIEFAGPLGFDAIAERAAQADFFLQLSDQEGAAMSVIEAMQLGLVPVVTPVGQMAEYCRPLETGVIFQDEAQTAGDIGRMLSDPGLFSRASAAAINRWTATRLYDQDFMAAAEALARGIRR
ncbi:glycosyltransferase involved in cell wall biosynthesis [Caulobacter ginsengisoli]|uniref:Glycosyltransferase involved in cell wall biosynthesis n=1 Tax=Caulobacter ginsengisoli TaxID=400775 RepID=A0ABU0IVF0_9CAUL|nr:glycosyltransferase [Caulobacter ginsengisoli]MDQ0464927.1 glycosyltransferase involved in cell wall biosynthesis [Caulobacter ginsengisoli]